MNCGQLSEEVRRNAADRAWLVSRGPISPDGRQMIDGERGLKAITFAEFQRRLLNVDKYLQDLILSYDGDRIAEWYVPPHDETGQDLETIVREWMVDDDALPLAVIAGYGKGKSTSSVPPAGRKCRCRVAGRSVM